LRWTRKFLSGVLIVLVVTALACEALASFEYVPEASVESPGANGFFPWERPLWSEDSGETQECFITSEPSQDPLEETQEAVFHLGNSSALCEAVFCLSEVFAFRRFLREKSMEAVAVAQKISAPSSVLSTIVSKLEVNSPLIPLFSIQIAVRK
jgi:hypothetical protein